MKRTFAGTATVDHIEGQVYIDGVRLPWWIANPEGPVVEKLEGIPMHTIHLPILVEGVITLIAEDGSKTTHDPVLGNVREWATNYVREAFAKAYPTLNLPQEAS